GPSARGVRPKVGRPACLLRLAKGARGTGLVRRVGSIGPDPKQRGYSLPPGCRDLIDVLKANPPKPALGRTFRVNGRIRAREGAGIGERGERLGIRHLPQALQLARSRRTDLVEIEPNAKAPICRLVDYGKFRCELSNRQQSKS